MNGLDMYAIYHEHPVFFFMFNAMGGNAFKEFQRTAISV